MIRFNSVHFGYKKKNLIKDFSMRLDGGSIYGLFGKNGAGKSTLLKLIAGQRYAHQGEIDVYGDDPAERSSSFLGQCFFLPEEPYMPPISLRQFIKLYAKFYPMFSSEQFAQLLNEFEISPDMHLKGVSMGQRKKAFIAFALACNTRVLLMDEPTNGLDIPSKRQFRRILSHIITDERIFIISTHQVRDLHSVIDHVLMMNDGQLIFDQSIGSISDHVGFSILRTPPKDNADIIYYDRVPGGYLCISDDSGDHSLEPDIETLFNAVITDTSSITQLFQTVEA